MPQLLKLPSTPTTEATEALLQWEVHAPQLASCPCSPQIENAHTQQRKIRAAKNKTKRHALKDCKLIKRIIFTAPKTCLIETVFFFLFLYNCISSVQSQSCVQFFATPWTAARQASLSITNSRSPPKPMSIESVMPSNHLILGRPLLLPPSIFPSIRVFSNELAIQKWPKYWSSSFSISPSNEYSGLISLRIDWLGLLAGLTDQRQIVLKEVVETWRPRWRNRKGVLISSQPRLQWDWAALWALLLSWASVPRSESEGGPVCCSLVEPIHWASSHVAQRGHTRQSRTSGICSLCPAFHPDNRHLDM